MELFTIEYESPSGVYAPGQLVRGFVHIQLKEAMKARAVTLHTMGVAHTSWTCYDAHPIPVGRGSHASQRRVRGCHVYIDAKFVVWEGDNNDKVLPAGVNKLPFAFNLPLVCPPSFEGSLGYIRYYCKAKIDRPWIFDNIAMLSFTVIPHFDVNTIPYASSPIIKSDSKNLGVVLFKHGRVLVKITLPKSGYVPGETIFTNIEINNTSSKEIEKVEMFLTEISTFEGKCTEVGRIDFCHLDHIAKTHKCRTVTKAAQNICVPANKTGQHFMKLPIPSIVPSFNVCRIIQVDYKLEIKIIAKGYVNNSLCVDFPVLIGTYPIQAPRYSTPMAENIPPVPEYLAPSQPTALSGNINEPPPSYAECVFGRGTVALEDEDRANIGNTGFTPKYVFYNNTQAPPPLPNKVSYPNTQASYQSAPTLP